LDVKLGLASPTRSTKIASPQTESKEVLQLNQETLKPLKF